MSYRRPGALQSTRDDMCSPNRPPPHLLETLIAIHGDDEQLCIDLLLDGSPAAIDRAPLMISQSAALWEHVP